MAISTSLIVVRSFEFVATVIILVLSLIQLYIERHYLKISRKNSIKIGPMKKYFHRIIPIASLFLCIHSLYRIISICRDVHILPLQLMFLLKQDATFLIVCLLSLWVNHSVYTAYNLIHMLPPALLSVLLKFVVVITFLIIHVTVFINIFIGHLRVVHAILLLWMALAMACILCLSLMVVYMLRTHVYAFKATLASKVILESSQFTVLASLDRALTRLVYIQIFVCLVIIPTVIIDTIASVQMLSKSNDDDVILDADELESDDSHQWQASLWFWLKFSALVVSQRITWLPLKRPYYQQRRKNNTTYSSDNDDNDDDEEDESDSWNENNLYYALQSPQHHNYNRTMITRHSDSSSVYDGGDGVPQVILDLNTSSRPSIY